MKQSLKNKISKSPHQPGVYRFLNNHNEVLYVGKAKDLKNRLTSYTAPPPTLLPKTAIMLQQAENVTFQTVGSEVEALLLEAKLIRDLQPKYNSITKDDKHPLYIKITREKFPKILTVRKEDDKKSIYFGPFPSSGSITAVLKLLRRVFPYCSQQKIGKRACFYSHLGLCRPCPSEIVKNKNEDERKRQTKLYQANVLQIKRILSGRIQDIVRQLEREMIIKAKEEDFEKAAELRDKINHLRYIIQRPLSPNEIILNPNLPEDLAQKRNEALRQVLLVRGIKLPHLALLEAYDIANIQGRSAVGSQVSFVNGSPEKNLYKRYRIRLPNRPNDVGMIKEVLKRRLAHTDWPYPQLFLVDGGKPQVAAATEVFSEKNVTIPVIGLAKKEEEIVIPKGGNFEIVRLQRADPALQLLQHIRDEAHRFAQRYHHLLMKKRLQKIDIP